MEVRFSSLAIKQRDLLKRNGNTLAQKKISLLLEEIKNTPFIGTGHPERLKGYSVPTFSRKIDKKNRFIYSIQENETVIEVLSIWGHYDDK